MGVEYWPDWERLGSSVLAWLLTYALHSTVLIGGAWIIAVLLARLACRVRALRDLLPALRERLWKVALVGGVVTATAQSWFHVGPWQMRFGPEIGPNSAVVSQVSEATPWMAPAAAHAVEASTGAARPLSSELTPTAAAESTTTPWIGIVLALWALGVAFGLARWICQWNRLLRDLDDRTPIRSGALFEQFVSLREAAGSTAPVVLSSAPGIAAPMTLGLRRAEICVPPRVETELRSEEIASLLAHELAHVERRDPAWIVVCRSIEVVFFFQPLNRLCASWLSDEAEYLSDDWAVVHTGERVGMASCLTEIAGWMVQADESRLVAGMAARGTRLSLRVGRLLDEEHEPETAARGTWMTSALAPFGLSAALFVPGITTVDEEARVNELLTERTSNLESALVSPAASSVDPIVVAPGAIVTHTEQDLEDVLDLLDDEIERLDDDLDSRSGGEAIKTALEELGRRVADLRARSSIVRNQLAQLTALESNTRPDAFRYHNFFVLDPVSKD